MNGPTIVLNAEKGLVEALLLDNGYLMDKRTAAFGTAAAKCLALRMHARSEFSVSGFMHVGNFRPCDWSVPVRVCACGHGTRQIRKSVPIR